MSGAVEVFSAALLLTSLCMEWTLWSTSAFVCTSTINLVSDVIHKAAFVIMSVLLTGSKPQCFCLITAHSRVHFSFVDESTEKQ